MRYVIQWFARLGYSTHAQICYLSVHALVDMLRPSDSPVQTLPFS